MKIAVINESTSSNTTDKQIKKWIPAFEKQWNRDLGQAWKVEDAEFVFVEKDQAPPAGAWWMVWLDDSDQADALAYHDLTDDGFPISKVFVKTIETDKASLTVAATHELCEMAVDPTINLSAQDAQGTFWAYESADPVEADQYGYDIDGVTVSNFVLPSWFGVKGSKAPFDFKNRCTDAFQVLPGGYAQKFDPQTGWLQVNSKSVANPRDQLY